MLAAKDTADLAASTSSSTIAKPLPEPKTFIDKLRVKGSVLLNKNKTVINGVSC